VKRQRRKLVAWINLVLLAITLVVARAERDEDRRVATLFAAMVLLMLLQAIVVPAADLAIRGPIILRRRRERRRRAAHLCPRCGYCLTGNVSGVCPECGTPAVESG
jgi:uncharacterized paraquat-inducible protein A